MKAKEPWQFTALSNPNVQLWWQQMQMMGEKNKDIIDFMRKQKEQGVYDYQKALENNTVPSYQTEHNQYRWSDVGKLENNPNLDNKN